MAAGADNGGPPPIDHEAEASYCEQAATKALSAWESMHWGAEGGLEHLIAGNAYATLALSHRVAAVAPARRLV